jgi:uncharacterized protein (DUF885 family)
MHSTRFQQIPAIRTDHTVIACSNRTLILSVLPHFVPHSRSLILIFILILIITGCGTGNENDSDRLSALFAEYWEFTLVSDPLFASSYGDHRFGDRLPEAGPDALSRRHETLKGYRTKLGGINRDALSREDRISYDIFSLSLRDETEAYELGAWRLPLNGWWDYHATFAEIPGRVPLNTASDYENYIARLRDFERYNREHIELMRRGIETGWVRPAVVFGPYLPSVEAHIVNDPEESLLYAPFQDFPKGISDVDRERLTGSGIDAIEEVVVPAYRELYDFLISEYIPAASETPGISALEGGMEYYHHLVRKHTTTEMTPEDIHQQGLEEVARIRSEMQEVIEETGFSGSFEEFIRFLRTDSRFYAATAEELLKHTAYVLKKMDGTLPRYFNTLPRMPYGIRPVPAYLAPRTTTAYYNRPAADGTRAGYYYVNTYDLKSRPLYEVEALSFHEAVPGHHLQIALQQELEGLPEFRLYSGFTAFVEGWALYTERLALEMGFYEDPYSNFGRLTYEMWRALRLVVDTGIHSKGWERQRAIDYMAENSALTLHNITTEVDRYIFWPGQALAYKTGELKIRELRERAESTLGDRFDIRDFHDVVLLSGSVPLSVLEENIDLYISGAEETENP